MAAYYTSQAYDAPAALIWAILTDFGSWPRWFPNVSAVEFEDGLRASAGARLLAIGDDRSTWTRFPRGRITCACRLPRARRPAG